MIAVLRARRLGPSAAALAAIALASATYWLVHTSVDWFWPYPAITAPVLALLGCACAPAVRAQARSRGRLAGDGSGSWSRSSCSRSAPCRRSSRSATSTTPTPSGARTSTRAYDDLDRAQSLNRLSDLPLLAEGSIARAAGDRERALAAFREAERKRPEEWATHYLLADLQARTDPAEARRADPDRARAQPARRRRSGRSPHEARASTRRAGADLGAAARLAASRSDQPALQRQATAWALVRAPSFAFALRTWVCTVAGESSSCAAIWPSVAPSASRREDLALADRGLAHGAEPDSRPGRGGAGPGALAGAPGIEGDQVARGQDPGGDLDPDLDHARRRLERERARLRSPPRRAGAATRPRSARSTRARTATRSARPTIVGAGGAEQPAGAEAGLDQALRRRRRPAPPVSCPRSCSEAGGAAERLSHWVPGRAGSARPARAARDGRHGRPRPRSRRGSARRRASSAA